MKNLLSALILFSILIVHKLLYPHFILKIPEQDAMILGIAVDPLGHYMASVNSKGRCYIWELQGSSEEPTKIKPKFKFDAHNKYALKVLFSNDSS